MYFELTESFRILGINSAYDYHWDSNFQFLGERHPFWETVCVLSGQVEIVEDETIFLLGSGDFIFHSAAEFHSIRSAAGTSPHVRVVSFMHQGTLPEQLREGVFSLNPQELSNYNDIFDAIRQIYKAKNRDPILLTELAFRLGAFYISISRKQPRMDRESRSHAAWDYQRAVRTMKEAVYENLSIPEICTRTGISPSAMKLLFRTYAGIGPGAYYDRLRLSEALQLLEKGESIREAADALGYSSPNYFSACFKNHYGLPPLKWIKSSQTGNPNK